MGLTIEQRLLRRCLLQVAVTSPLEHTINKAVASLPEVEPRISPWFEITGDRTHDQINSSITNLPGSDAMFSAALQFSFNDLTRQEAKVYRLRTGSYPFSGLIDTQFPLLGENNYRGLLHLLTQGGKIYAYGDIASAAPTGSIPLISSAAYSYDGRSWKEEYFLAPPSSPEASFTKVNSAVRYPDGSWIVLCQREYRGPDGQWIISHELVKIVDGKEVKTTICRREPLNPITKPLTLEEFLDRQRAKIQNTISTISGRLAPTMIAGPDELLTTFMAPEEFGGICNLHIQSYDSNLSPSSPDIIRTVVTNGVQFSAVEFHPVYNGSTYDAVIVGNWQNSSFALIKASLPPLSNNPNPQISFELLTDNPQIEEAQFPSATINPYTGETYVAYRRRIGGNYSTVFFPLSEPGNKTEIQDSALSLLGPQIAIMENAVRPNVLITGSHTGDNKEIGQLCGWRVKPQKIFLPIILRRNL